ncbi:MAG TPA: hypothetical protein VFM68_03830 [Candidatus Saccharimonadales bacterium]|nr:hypothetical protein [Candidatus Saccharimonadales bacterium]
MNPSPTIEQSSIQANGELNLRALVELCDSDPVVKDVVSSIINPGFGDWIKEQNRHIMSRAHQLQRVWEDENPHKQPGKKFEDWLVGKSVGTVLSNQCIEGTFLPFQIAEMMTFKDITLRFRLEHDDDQMNITDVRPTKLVLRANK